MRKYFDKEINDYVYYVSDIISPVSVKTLDEYKLLIVFNNGETKLYDALPLLDKKIYAELKNKTFFDTAKVEYGTVIWNDDIDICPESLYNDSVPYETK